MESINVALTFESYNYKEYNNIGMKVQVCSDQDRTTQEMNTRFINVVGFLQRTFTLWKVSI